MKYIYKIKIRWLNSVLLIKIWVSVKWEQNRPAANVKISFSFNIERTHRSYLYLKALLKPLDWDIFSSPPRSVELIDWYHLIDQINCFLVCNWCYCINSILNVTHMWKWVTVWSTLWRSHDGESWSDTFAEDRDPFLSSVFLPHSAYCTFCLSLSLSWLLNVYL